MCPKLAWARLGNGELLMSAKAACFDLLISADQNLKYQQTSQSAYRIDRPRLKQLVNRTELHCLHRPLRRHGQPKQLCLCRDAGDETCNEVNTI